MRVLNKASIEGTIKYMHSDPKKQDCICCPPGKGHIFARGIEFEPFDSALPEHFGHTEREFLYTIALAYNGYEGKRVRVTVEVIDDTP